jgi:hypothetical protein
MSDAELLLQARLTWVRLYTSTEDADLVCRRYGSVAAIALGL